MGCQRLHEADGHVVGLSTKQCRFPVRSGKYPENRLISHGPIFRFDAEVARDNALSISGLLVERIGGASVKPYQPPAFGRRWDIPEQHRVISNVILARPLSP